jgi:hypothetical protein
MRIYNGKNSQVELPLATQRITIGPNSVSKDIMPNVEMLQLISTSFVDTEIALIVSGPSELNLCAGVPACTPLVVQSLDEAVIRFKGTAPEKKEEKPVVEEPKKEEVVVEEVVPEKEVEEKKQEEEVKPEPTKKAAPKKNAKK